MQICNKTNLENTIITYKQWFKDFGNEIDFEILLKITNHKCYLDFLLSKEIV